MIKRAECCGNCIHVREETEEEVSCSVDLSRSVTKCSVCEYDFEDYLDGEE